MSAIDPWVLDECVLWIDEGPDGTVGALSNAVRNALPHSAALLGRPIDTVIRPDPLVAAADPVQGARYLHDGRGAGLACVVRREVTAERRRWWIALRSGAASQQPIEVLEALPFPVINLDGDRRVQYANEAARSLLGDPKLRIAIRVTEWRDGIEELVDVHHDTRFRFYVRADSAGVTLTGVDVTASESMLHTVLERAEAAEEALRDRVQQLESLANTHRDVLARVRNDDITRHRFLTDLGHEVRNPLNAIIGYAALVQESESLPEARTDAASIQDAATQLLQVLISALQLASLQPTDAHNSEVVDLTAMTQQVAGEAHESAGVAGVSLTYGVIDKVNVIGDRSQLRQLLLQLIRQAVRAARNDVRIELLQVHQGARLDIRHVPHSPSAPDRAPRSLLLTVAARVAQAMGGRLDLRTEGPELVWSLVLRGPEQRVRTARTVGRRTFRGAALVIEPAQSSRTLVTRALESSGIIVHAATSAAEGLELAMAISPQLLVVDEHLGGGTVEALRQASSAQVALIALSDQPHDGLLVADAYIQRPVTQEGVRVALERAF